ncbi:MAG TPA: hypothetical protein HA362_03845 [Nanoarchaeota archaeon]|nr:hypothetical protein [Nanoarchaeota archaeon]
MEVLLHRSVEDIIHGYEGLISADAVERQRKRRRFSYGLSGVMGQYRQVLRSSNLHGAIFDKIIFLDVPALSPERINTFLQETIAYESNEKYAWCTGMFLTRLIKRSYDAGNNEFHLDTKAISKPLHRIGQQLKGKKKKRIGITVDGPLGDMCAWFSEYLDIKAESIGEHCGEYGWRLSIEAEAIGGQCCEYAKHSAIHATSIGNFCGLYGKHLEIAAKLIGRHCGWHAKESTFRTTRRRTLERFMEHIAKEKGNHIYLVHRNGSEEEIQEERWS